MYFIKIQDLECIGFFTTRIFYLVAGDFRVVCEAATDQWNKLWYLEAHYPYSKNQKHWPWD